MTDKSKKTSLLALTIGSIGVVYGDIGTSPLYAFRESMGSLTEEGAGITPDAAIGVLSLMWWALIITVTFKYVLLVLRADNHGEGGVLSLTTLAGANFKYPALSLLLGIIGASLFYGDALITPAISVLSAVEGIKLVAPASAHYVMPASVVIILCLFMMQRFGTAKVSWIFGPIMVVWFAALGWGGLINIAAEPSVLQAINPMHGLAFLMSHGEASLIALGSVLLAVTGAEALYADMGHFGKRPIRLAWLLLVLPSLALNYGGQAALVSRAPGTADDSFFLLYPEHLLPMIVVLATLATIIASQAVITGAFSLTHQAIQLGLLPRQHVRFTSGENAGQIYLPQMNWLLMVGVILLIAIFHTSSALAAAYGIAVTGTMVITSCLLYIVMTKCWRWPAWVAFAVAGPLLLIDLSFLAATMTKLFQGGFVPVLLSLGIILMMRTWVRGTATLRRQAHEQYRSLDSLFGDLNRAAPRRVSGTAVYLTSNPNFAPSALVHNMKHNKVLHEQNILIHLVYEKIPVVAPEARIEIKRINQDFTRVTLRYGFMDAPHVTRELCRLRDSMIHFDLMSTTFFISRRNIVPSAKFGMPVWQDKVYIFMANNAADAASYFHLPLNHVVELGVQMTV